MGVGSEFKRMDCRDCSKELTASSSVSNAASLSASPISSLGLSGEGRGGENGNPSFGESFTKRFTPEGMGAELRPSALLTLKPLVACCVATCPFPSLEL